MHYSRKRLKKFSYGRNCNSALEQRRTYTINISNLSNEWIIYLDETGFKLHISCRFGYSPVKIPAHIIVPSNRGINVSLLCAISYGGVVCFSSKKGAFNSADFTEFIESNLRPRLNNYMNYYLIMDNFRIQ